MNFTYPYLCGGILFCLILQARTTRAKARDKFNGGSDGLNDSDIMLSFLNIVTGDTKKGKSESLKKSTTNYKKCKINSSIYIPFTDKITIESFNSAFKKYDKDLLERTTNFISNYLNPQKYNWLVKALLDLIKQDVEIKKEENFLINKNISFKKKDIDKIKDINLQLFLLSIINYILLNRKDNKKGEATFNKWHTQKIERGLWEFSTNIGASIKQDIKILTVLDETENKEVTIEEGNINSNNYNTINVLNDISYFNSQTGILTIGTEEIKLPKAVQPNDNTNNKMPYMKALYEVYSEKLDKKITKNNLKELPKSLSENLKNQKEAFYNATSVGRAVSEVFCDGVEQFELLKEEAYEGIEPTYHNDNYKTGYDRLLGVLEKITNTTLDKSNLMTIRGLIGNSEKKGICHILVNDKKLNSWVDINE